MCARHEIMHPGLPAPFDAQLWPRHIQISLGNVVWKATDVMISESRAEEKSWIHIAEAQSKSEPGTPFEDDETECSGTERTQKCIRWAQRSRRVETGRVGHRHVSMSHDSTQGFSAKFATMYSKRHNNPT